MKTKTKIEKQTKRKKNTGLAETIISAKKNKGWMDVAKILSSPRKNKIEMNIQTIDENSKENDLVVIPGKVLSQGEISKKLKIVAFNFSDKAKEKLLKAKCELFGIAEEIKKNPSAKGIKILTQKK